MFIIKANLIFEDTFRKKPISGDSYRPILFFSKKIVRSGLLVLEKGEILDMTQAYENRMIKIYFYKDINALEEFFVGRQFVMAEGGPDSARIGTGVITEVIGEEIPSKARENNSNM